MYQNYSLTIGQTNYNKIEVYRLGLTYQHKFGKVFFTKEKGTRH